MCKYLQILEILINILYFTLIPYYAFSPLLVLLPSALRMHANRLVTESHLVKNKLKYIIIGNSDLSIGAYAFYELNNAQYIEVYLNFFNINF